nr:serine/threonine-protein kinase [Streptomyces sporangiiformans]
MGRLLAGRYRVVARLGRGGMGVVWRALDEVLRREVAVKELRTYSDAGAPELADLRVRMQREARAAARIRHPGVVAVHDVAEVDGRPLIVMELVDGPSLDAVLGERGTLDPQEAAGIGAKVMDALAAAHRAGVLHRDVKPGNILLDRSGRVVLTDFGIATMEDPGDGSTTHLTRSGELVGSLDYLAPERAQGHDPGPASDVWALGATLYAAVEGTSPFRRTSTWSTLTAIVTEPLPEPRRAGPLGPVLRQLMDKQPQNRPEADRARPLLEAVAGTEPGQAAGAPDQTSATTNLRGPVPQPGKHTEPSAPAAPPGFGPPGSIAAGAGATGGDGSGAGVPDASGSDGQASGGGGSGVGAPGAGASGADGPGVGGAGAGISGAGAPGGGRLAFGAPAFGLPASPPTGGPGFGPPQPEAARGAPPGAARRRKSRVLLAAAAVTIVLAGTGVTAALLNNSDDSKTAAPPAKTAEAGESPSSGASRGSVDLSDEQETQGEGDKQSSPPAEKPAGTEGTEGAQPTTKGPDASPTPTGGGSTDGGGTSAGGEGGASPAPVCHPVGGGKYNCEVWRKATSYTADGAEAGTLNAGTNYFYCQQNLGRRETYGQWTNVWWAKTDDDSGNTNVFVSDVYIKGGDNDAPLPGLPVC